MSSTTNYQEIKYEFTPAAPEPGDDYDKWRERALNAMATSDFARLLIRFWLIPMSCTMSMSSQSLFSLRSRSALIGAWHAASKYNHAARPCWEVVVRHLGEVGPSCPKQDMYVFLQSPL